MHQLITIETVPMSVEYVEKKPIRVSSAPHLKLQVEKHPEDKSVSIKSNNAVSIRMDSFDYNKYVPSGSSAYTATAQYSASGSLDLNVQMQNADGTSIEHAMNGIARMADAIAAAPAPSAHRTSLADLAAPSESSGAFHLNFDLSALMESQSNEYSTSFTPPDLELKIVEQAKVIIKYVGGPIYIPRSADPNYIPVEEQFNFVAGQGIDVKV